MSFKTALILQACSITHDQLNNKLYYDRLRVFSPAPGRGRRGRSFCLEDACLIALHRGLVGLSRDAKWSARALEQLLPDRAAVAGAISAWRKHPTVLIAAWPEDSHPALVAAPAEHAGRHLLSLRSGFFLPATAVIEGVCQGLGIRRALPAP